jgi:deoxyribodipyrimidine photo-lyase
MRTVVWFRGKDLRVADHAPLVEAARAGELVCIFVLDPYFFAPERARRLAHRMQFLLESLRALAANLEALGSRLFVVEGKSVDVVPRIAREVRADRVVAHRWSEPFGVERDRRVGAQVPLLLFEGETLAPPGSLRTASGAPFSVFSPFARAFARAVRVASPLPAPRALPAPPADVALRTVPIPSLDDLGIAHNARLPAGGERAARARMRAFFAERAMRYHELRDRMDLDATSRLSADLHFGTLSIRTVWDAAHAALDERAPSALRTFRNELLWREFAHHVLAERPDVLERPFRRDFEGFPWRDDRAGWDAWVRGRTGYPVVDAAARQLLAEGFVHNRARMIAASFLAKHLLIDPRRGEAHYLEHLVDGDWAANDLGWQWSAGCGCDAQPWFRIFNPRLQGERFDPEGDYVRRWVPELAKMPARFIHAPWDAPDEVRARAGLISEDVYPRPIVAHELSRARFLHTAQTHLGAARTDVTS